ncbi:LmbE family N-acetylglucosaminyl deacetylase [Algoriphagus sp. 4150]|uniref:PIG-L deacetylase family protein n=1 Tax=Algoriphagus sp. 4150 TaxID=2817756 RepID=UPI002857CB40|nr:PIG-L family deacetylase [Algoriphagus sp. 4150]MDR7128335.1 LmbE family N-acetylglucosaminyl deacetylase [Algoriphagus sp. 4150]
MRRLIISLLIIGTITLVVVPLILIQVGKSQLHDSEIPQHELLFQSDGPKTILAFFPHPDDEVTVSGTLMKMKDAGHRIILVCLTKGEAAETEGKYSREELGQVRTLEMQNAAQTIGADHLELLDYSDSGMEKLGLDSLKSIAEKLITQFKPDVLVSYDSKVGLYGHPDHRLTGLAIEELFMKKFRGPNFTPQRLFQVTLSPKQIQLALKLSEGFQKHYPKDLTQGLPEPDFSINTTAYFDRVLQVIYGHESQAETLKDLLPYHDQVPSIIYSRIFDREYFYEVKPKKPPGNLRMAFR